MVSVLEQVINHQRHQIPSTMAAELGQGKYNYKLE